MRFYKFLIIISLIFLVSACSDKSEEQSGEDMHPSFSELPEVSEESSPSENQRVISIQFTPEDKAKADKAPEGMVFIKGACYTNPLPLTAR